MKNYYSIIQIVGATMSNPNADFNGAPRHDTDDNTSRITDVCIKSKIRRTIGEMVELGNIPAKGNAIDIVGGQRGYKAEMGLEGALANFWDIRTFGAVVAIKVSKDEKAAKKAAKKAKAEASEDIGGSDSDFGIHGPVQLSTLTSVDPIVLIDDTITRKCGMTADKERAIGSRTVVRYGLYVGTANIQPVYAVKSKLTDDDVKNLFFAWKHMFDNDKASTRTQVELKGLLVFKHEGPFMSAQDESIMDSCLSIALKSEVESPSSFKDYVVKFDKKALPAGISFVPEYSLIGF